MEFPIRVTINLVSDIWTLRLPPDVCFVLQDISCVEAFVILTKQEPERIFPTEPELSILFSICVLPVASVISIILNPVVFEPNWTIKCK